MSQTKIDKLRKQLAVSNVSNTSKVDEFLALHSLSPQELSLRLLHVTDQISQLEDKTHPTYQAKLLEINSLNESERQNAMIHYQTCLFNCRSSLDFDISQINNKHHELIDEAYYNLSRELKEEEVILNQLTAKPSRKRKLSNADDVEIDGTLRTEIKPTSILLNHSRKALLTSDELNQDLTSILHSTSCQQHQQQVQHVQLILPSRLTMPCILLSSSTSQQFVIVRPILNNFHNQVLVIPSSMIFNNQSI